VSEQPPEVGFSIEELSRRTGITVRSLRSYQSRRLLPPPDVRGRTGYYDERHAARIELIKDLQSEGFKLDSIARMLDEGGRSDADLLRFSRSVRTMFDSPDRAITSSADLMARFRIEDVDSAPGLLTRAERLGLLRQVGEDSFEELSPRLISAGEHAVQSLGLDLDEALQVVSQLRKHAEGVGRLYLDLYVKRVWAPFVEAGQPPDQWPMVQDALADIRSLAEEALLGAFEVVMAEQVDETFGRELTRSRRGAAKRRG